jgi:CBS domain containing-hemolysin-like protein
VEQPGDPTRPTEPLRAPIPPRPPAARPVASQVVERERVPPLPAEGPPSGNPWAFFAVALVALLIGGIAGYAIGHSKGESTGRAGAAARTVTQTVTTPKVVVRTVTSKTVTQAPSNETNEQRRIEAESKLRALERENEELRSQGEGG